jgi:hypothetical protein
MKDRKNKQQKQIKLETSKIKEDTKETNGRNKQE